MHALRETIAGFLERSRVEKSKPSKLEMSPSSYNIAVAKQWTARTTLSFLKYWSSSSGKMGSQMTHERTNEESYGFWSKSVERTEKTHLLRSMFIQLPSFTIPERWKNDSRQINVLLITDYSKFSVIIAKNEPHDIMRIAQSRTLTKDGQRSDQTILSIRSPHFNH